MPLWGRPQPIFLTLSDYWKFWFRSVKSVTETLVEFSKCSTKQNSSRCKVDVRQQHSSENPPARKQQLKVRAHKQMAEWDCKPKQERRDPSGSNHHLDILFMAPIIMTTLQRQDEFPFKIWFSGQPLKLMMPPTPRWYENVYYSHNKAFRRRQDKVPKLVQIWLERTEKGD